MAVIFYTVNWTDENGVSTYLYPIEIEVRRGMQSQKSLATLRLPLGFDDSTVPPYFNSNGTIAFKARETITVYAGYNDAAASADSSYILLSGEISEIKVSHDTNNLLVKFSLIDKSTTLLDKMIYINDNDTTDELIKKVVKKASENKSNQGLYGSGNESYDLSITNVATTDSNSSAFPSKTISARYKPGYEIIEELSQMEYTGDDKPYYFWIDADNNFYWVYPGTSVDNTVNASTSTYRVLKEDFTKNEDEVVNFIIFNCGKDKNDNSILWYDYNEETDVVALKMAYKDWSDIANAEMIDDQEFDWDASTNAQVRTEAKNRGAARAEAIFSQAGQLKWKGNVLFKGNKDFQPGQLIQYTSDKIGIQEQKLRIHDITHRLTSKQGWTTSLTLEEDWKAISS